MNKSQAYYSSDAYSFIVSRSAYVIYKAPALVHTTYDVLGNDSRNGILKPVSFGQLLVKFWLSFL
jgi:hypothetical protein